MNKPLIGITVDLYPADEPIGPEYRLRKNYAQCIVDAGGVPIIIPANAPIEEIAPLLDGWLIPGGSDIDPVQFGAERHSECKLQDPSRFATEKALFEALPKTVPILGICYGSQFLNVVLGGDLVQHLPDGLGHDQHSGGTIQEYAISPNSKFAEIVGSTSLTGRSYHHQALGKVAPGLQVVARHEDGTIEAVEATTDERWLFATQWHPERMPETTGTKNLFESFIKAAAAFRASRG